MAKKAAPWDRKNPRKKAGRKSKHLTPKQKASAKASAKRAGRSYPNLVDNMHAASKKSAKKSGGRKKAGRKRAAAKKTTAKKSSRKKSAKKKSAKKKARKRATKSATKDPRGGLTAAGRRKFARRDGAHLKPGVTKSPSDMSPTEMRRKGSWAVRFYGRKSLPPLIDDNGKPTRHALSAHAWGEPVPRTVSAARRIAEKGRKLLKRYERLKAPKRG